MITLSAGLSTLLCGSGVAQRPTRMTEREALRLLEKAARLAAEAGRNFKREIVTAQKDFDAIRDEPGFEAVLKIIDGL